MKLSNKLFMTVFTVLCIQFSISAQSSDKPNREVGLTLSSLNSFGLVYKVQQKNGTYLRFDGAAAFLSVNNDFTNYNVGINGRVTWEKRKEINDKFFINHGWGFGLATNIAHARNPSRTNYSVVPSIHYLLGFQYKISDKVYMGIEISPTLSNQFSYSTGNQGFNYGLNLSASTSARLGVMYQF